MPCPPSPDSEKSSRAASSLLANLWQYNKLHRDFRAVSGHGGWGGGGALWGMGWGRSLHGDGVGRSLHLGQGQGGASPSSGLGSGSRLATKLPLTPVSVLQKGYRKEDFLGP